MHLSLSLSIFSPSSFERSCMDSCIITPAAMDENCVNFVYIGQLNIGIVPCYNHIVVLVFCLTYWLCDGTW